MSGLLQLATMGGAGLGIAAFIMVLGLKKEVAQLKDMMPDQ